MKTRLKKCRRIKLRGTPGTGGITSANERLLEDGDTRITEDGDTRILE